MSNNPKWDPTSDFCPPTSVYTFDQPPNLFQQLVNGKTDSDTCAFHSNEWRNPPVVKNLIKCQRINFGPNGRPLSPIQFHGIPHEHFSPKKKVPELHQRQNCDKHMDAPSLSSSCNSDSVVSGEQHHSDLKHSHHTCNLSLQRSKECLDLFNYCWNLTGSISSNLNIVQPKAKPLISAGTGIPESKNKTLNAIHNLKSKKTCADQNLYSTVYNSFSLELPVSCAEEADSVIVKREPFSPEDECLSDDLEQVGCCADEEEFKLELNDVEVDCDEQENHVCKNTYKTESAMCQINDPIENSGTLNGTNKVVDSFSENGQLSFSSTVGSKEDGVFAEDEAYSETGSEVFEDYFNVNENFSLKVNIFEEETNLFLENDSKESTETNSICTNEVQVDKGASDSISVAPETGITEENEVNSIRTVEVQDGTWAGISDASDVINSVIDGFGSCSGDLESKDSIHSNGVVDKDDCGSTDLPAETGIAEDGVRSIRTVGVQDDAWFSLNATLKTGFAERNEVNDTETGEVKDCSSVETNASIHTNGAEDKDDCGSLKTNDSVHSNGLNEVADEDDYCSVKTDKCIYADEVEDEDDSGSLKTNDSVHSNGLNEVADEDDYCSVTTDDCIYADEEEDEDDFSSMKTDDNIHTSEKAGEGDCGSVKTDDCIYADEVEDEDDCVGVNTDDSFHTNEIAGEDNCSSVKTDDCVYADELEDDDCSSVKTDDCICVDELEDEDDRCSVKKDDCVYADEAEEEDDCGSVKTDDCIYADGVEDEDDCDSLKTNDSIHNNGLNGVADEVDCSSVKTDDCIYADEVEDNNDFSSVKTDDNIHTNEIAGKDDCSSVKTDDCIYADGVKEEDDCGSLQTNDSIHNNGLNRVADEDHCGVVITNDNILSNGVVEDYGSVDVPVKTGIAEEDEVDSVRTVGVRGCSWDTLNASIETAIPEENKGSSIRTDRALNERHSGSIDVPVETGIADEVNNIRTVEVQKCGTGGRLDVVTGKDTAQESEVTDPWNDRVEDESTCGSSVVATKTGITEGGDGNTTPTNGRQDNGIDCESVDKNGIYIRDELQDMSRENLVLKRMLLQDIYDECDSTTISVASVEDFSDVSCIGSENFEDKDDWQQDADSKSSSIEAIADDDKNNNGNQSKVCRSELVGDTSEECKTHVSDYVDSRNVNEDDDRLGNREHRFAEAEECVPVAGKRKGSKFTSSKSKFVETKDNRVHDRIVNVNVDQYVLCKGNRDVKTSASDYINNDFDCKVFEDVNHFFESRKSPIADHLSSCSGNPKAGSTFHLFESDVLLHEADAAMEIIKSDARTESCDDSNRLLGSPPNANAPNENCSEYSGSVGSTVSLLDESYVENLLAKVDMLSDQDGEKMYQVDDGDVFKNASPVSFTAHGEKNFGVKRKLRSAFIRQKQGRAENSEGCSDKVSPKRRRRDDKDCPNRANYSRRCKENEEHNLNLRKGKRKQKENQKKTCNGCPEHVKHKDVYKRKHENTNCAGHSDLENRKRRRKANHRGQSRGGAGENLSPNSLLSNCAENVEESDKFFGIFSNTGDPIPEQDLVDETIGESHHSNTNSGSKSGVQDEALKRKIENTQTSPTCAKRTVNKRGRRRRRARKFLGRRAVNGSAAKRNIQEDSNIKRGRTVPKEKFPKGKEIAEPIQLFSSHGAGHESAEESSLLEDEKDCCNSGNRNQLALNAANEISSLSSISCTDTRKARCAGLETHSSISSSTTVESVEDIEQAYSSNCTRRAASVDGCRESLRITLQGSFDPQTGATNWVASGSPKKQRNRDLLNDPTERRGPQKSNTQRTQIPKKRRRMGFPSYVEDVIHNPSLLTDLAIKPFEEFVRTAELEYYSSCKNSSKKGQLSIAMNDDGSNRNSSSIKEGDGLHLSSIDVMYDIAKKTYGESHLKRCRATPRSLFLAAKQGNALQVLVLAAGCSVNSTVPQENHKTAAHAAAGAGQLGALRILTMVGANLSSTDCKLRTPLFDAVDNNNLTVVKFLISQRANLTLKDSNGMTVLHIAAKMCYVEIINLLMETRMINVDEQDSGGWTALMWTAEGGHVEAAKSLLKWGASVHILDNELNTCLHWAALSGATDIMALLLEAKVNIDGRNKFGATALHISARERKWHSIRLLEKYRPNLEIKDEERKKAIQLVPSNSKCYSQLEKMEKIDKVFGVYSLRKCLITSDISKGQEFRPIPCINEVDDDKLPEDFVYVHKSCEGQNISFDRVPLMGCNCAEYDCTNEKACQCAQMSSRKRFWYDQDGLISSDIFREDRPLVFECNMKCKCWSVCSQRVVQRGIRAPLQLYKTTNKGWAVRTLAPIQKGVFVCEYVGEILTDSEADKRDDDCYLFDVDVKGNSELFCLDAKFYGNVSRFINHSCEPNVLPVRVFTDHQVRSCPRIAYFASRVINAYEEVCSDYGEKFWKVKKSEFHCVCDSPKCRYKGPPSARK